MRLINNVPLLQLYSIKIITFIFGSYSERKYSQTLSGDASYSSCRAILICTHVCAQRIFLISWNNSSFASTLFFTSHRFQAQKYFDMTVKQTSIFNKVYQYSKNSDQGFYFSCASSFNIYDEHQSQHQTLRLLKCLLSICHYSSYFEFNFYFLASSLIIVHSNPNHCNNR